MGPVWRTSMSNLSNITIPLNLFDFKDFQEEAHSVLLCLAELERSVSISLLTGILQGRKTKYIRQAKLYKLTTYGDLSETTVNICSNLCHALLDQGYLQARRLFNDYLAVSLSGKGLTQLTQPGPIFLVPFDITSKELERYEQKVKQYDQLVHLRRSLYHEVKKTQPSIKLYQIAKNEDLKLLVTYPPETELAMAERFNWTVEVQLLCLPAFFENIRQFRALANE